MLEVIYIFVRKYNYEKKNNNCYIYFSAFYALSSVTNKAQAT